MPTLFKVSWAFKLSVDKVGLDPVTRVHDDDNDDADGHEYLKKKKKKIASKKQTHTNRKNYHDTTVTDLQGEEYGNEAENVGDAPGATVTVKGLLIATQRTAAKSSGS